MGSMGVPYIAFQVAGKATVMSFTGSLWANIGTAGFASSYGISLALHPSSNLPYLAFPGINDNLKTTLMAYNGTDWMTVGTPSFSAINVQIVSLQLDQLGRPYVACQAYVVESGQGVQRAILWVYDGAWAPVGGNFSGFSAGTASYISLALHPSTTLPYVAYGDASVSGRATVMTYTGAKWVVVGKPGMSAGTADSISLALHPVTGAPLVACRDTVVNGAVVYTVNATGWWTQLGSGQWIPELCPFMSLVATIASARQLALLSTSPLLPRSNFIGSSRCQPNTASNHWTSLRCGLWFCKERVYVRSRKRVMASNWVLRLHGYEQWPQPGTLAQQWAVAGCLQRCNLKLQSNRWM